MNTCSRILSKSSLDYIITGNQDLQTTTEFCVLSPTYVCRIDIIQAILNNQRGQLQSVERRGWYLRSQPGVCKWTGTGPAWNAHLYAWHDHLPLKAEGKTIGCQHAGITDSYIRPVLMETCSLSAALLTTVVQNNNRDRHRLRYKGTFIYRATFPRHAISTISHASTGQYSHYEILI